jgi:CheY-like chemotaxis protein
MARSAEAAGAPASLTNRETGLMVSRRILLVVDSPAMRRVLPAMPSEQGFEVDTANDCLQRLAKACLEPRPELILTDAEVPCHCSLTTSY